MHQIPCLLLVVSATAAAAGEAYAFRVVASGLNAPTGIAVDRWTAYVSEVPTPGVPGSQGGRNGIIAINQTSGKVRDLHRGEPEPLNLALTWDRSLYWTCRTAGVILKLDLDDPNGQPTPYLTGLKNPTGIASFCPIWAPTTLVFTEVATPGQPNPANRVMRISPARTDFSYDQAQIPAFAFLASENDDGDPYPADVAIGSEGIYWTCKSAGVIVMRDRAKPYRKTVIARGLSQPTGIDIDIHGRSLYFTEVPTPGRAGSAGGSNRVSRLDLKTKAVTIVHSGDPQPTDVAVTPDGRILWTCTSAGVVVEAKVIPPKPKK